MENIIRPRSAYSFFIMDMRTDWIDNFPYSMFTSTRNFSLSELDNIWRSLTIEEKRHYLLMEEADLERYNKEKKTLYDKIHKISSSISEICPICHEILDIDIVKLINCKHKFHEDCIIDWGKTNRRLDSYDNPTISCPICRTLSFGHYKIRKKA